MKEDEDKTVKERVIDELIYEPGIDATKVDITVDEGVVNLRGSVATYYEKLNAEEAAYRVRGVKDVNNNISVVLSADFERNDADLADAATNALLWDSTVPDEEITANVERGWITLQGEAEWNYQKTNAENAVRNLTGTRGVTNNITIKPNVEPQDPEEKIKEAMDRYAAIDSDKIDVKVQGTRAVLNGLVSDWSERKQAEQAAWSTPGIYEVENNISITMTW